MVGIPFIYFSILFVILYLKNNKIDIACYTVLIYAVSSFFSILIDFYRLRGFDTLNYDISFEATFVYCSLLTLCIIPISLYSNAKIKYIEPIKNVRFLKGFAWLCAIYFVFNLLMSLSDIIFILTSDMGELRNLLYKDEFSAGWIGRLNPILRLPFALMNMLMGCPWIFMLLGFFSFFIQKLPVKYMLLFFIGSLSGPLSSIIGVDRSGMAYYLISLGASYLIFTPYMDKSQKRKITIASGILVAFIILYLTTLTNSRFEERDGGQLSGSIASLVSYFGQSFINFCYYYDTFKTPDPSLQLIFPFTYQYFIGTEHVGGTAMQEYLSLLSGKSLGVFYTFMGQILTTAGNISMIIYCFVIFVLSIILLNRKRTSITNLKQLFFYYLFGSICFLGLFGHYYGSSSHTFSVLIFSFIIPYLMKYNKQ